jgi:hypothetical protein
MRNRGEKQTIFWMGMQVVCYFLFVVFFYVFLAYGEVRKGKKKSSLHSVANCMSKSIVRRTFFLHPISKWSS